MNLSQEKTAPTKGANSRTPLQRTWFMARGCKQVPIEYTRGIVRWAHPDGYFLNPQGQKIKHNFSPSSNDVRPNMHGRYPILRECSRECHLLMALAFFGPRTIDPATGKQCVCHHLIPDKLDYKPANLLCWLTRAEHAEADRRQRALRKVVPNGDLNIFSYDRLRELQDPRTMSKEKFEEVLLRLKDKQFKIVPPTGDELNRKELDWDTNWEQDY